MFPKLSAAFAVFAIAAQVVVASPPACLIGAVNTQDNPHNIKGVCSGNAAKEVAKAIGADCGNAKDTATKWFAAVCKDAGVTLSTSSSSPSTSDKSSSKTSSTEASGSSSTASSDSTIAAENSGTAHAFYPMATAAPSGFQTATTNQTSWAASSDVSPSATTGSDSPASTGMASRVGMDMLGLAAVGIFGAMIAL